MYHLKKNSQFLENVKCFLVFSDLRVILKFNYVDICMNEQKWEVYCITIIRCQTILLNSSNYKKLMSEPSQVTLAN